MELAIDDPIRRAQEMAGQATSPYQHDAPLAQKKGMGEQMGDMAKQKAMEGALDAGSKGMMNALTPAATTTAPVVGSAIEGGAVLGSTAPAVAGGGAGMMATAGAAMPYVGAALLADKMLGLGITDSFFSSGGQVGPLSPQYHAEGTSGYIKNMYNKYFPTEAMKDMGEPPSFTDRGVVEPNIQPDTGIPTGQDMQKFSRALDNQSFKDIFEMTQRNNQYLDEKMIGSERGNLKFKSQGGPISYNAEGTMTEEQARALMNNQPEPTPMPMMRPDPRELMAEIKQEMATPQPISRPASINPYDAAMNYEGYDPIQPAPTNLPQYRAGGGPLGMGILNMYQDMMKKNMR